MSSDLGFCISIFHSNITLCAETSINRFCSFVFSSFFLPICMFPTKLECFFTEELWRCRHHHLHWLWMIRRIPTVIRIYIMVTTGNKKKSKVSTPCKMWVDTTPRERKYATHFYACVYTYVMLPPPLHQSMHCSLNSFTTVDKKFVQTQMLFVHRER